MKHKILLFLSVILLLSSCADLGLKKSANNKLIDMKGFHGNKRRPLYNKKYIDRAKVNISQNDYEEEEEEDDDDYADEKMDPSVRNRYMYQNMIEEDIKSKRKNKSKKRGLYRSKIEPQDDYPDVATAREVANSNNSESDPELRRELSEIKSMLSSARKDLAKYKCPIEKSKERETSKHQINTKKLHEQVHLESKDARPKHMENSIDMNYKKAGPAHLNVNKTQSNPENNVAHPDTSQEHRDIPATPSPIQHVDTADSPKHVETNEVPSQEHIDIPAPLPHSEDAQAPTRQLPIEPEEARHVNEAPHAPQQDEQPNPKQESNSPQPAVPTLPSFPSKPS